MQKRYGYRKISFMVYGKSVIVRTEFGGEFKMTNRNPSLCSAANFASLYLCQKFKDNTDLKNLMKKIS